MPTPMWPTCFAFCALGANGFAGANGIERLEAVEARLTEAVETGDGLDAQLVLLALHAKTAAPRHHRGIRHLGPREQIAARPA